MTAEQLREVAADPLVTIGAHTVSHPPLSRLASDELREEILNGTKRVESALGVSIDRFCYPYYDWSAAAREVVGERHALAVRGEGSEEFIDEGTDPYLVPRVNGAVPLSTLQYVVSDAGKRLERLL